MPRKTLQEQGGWQWCLDDIFWSIYKELDLEYTWQWDYDSGLTMWRYKKVHRKAGLAAYSIVCKGWQGFFEPLLYRHLQLTPKCLHRLSRIPKTQNFVQHIHFRIEHWTYDCIYCHDLTRYPAYEYAPIDHKATAMHIEMLLTLLNKWQRNPCISTQRLTLEIATDDDDEPRDCTGDFKLGINPETLEVCGYEAEDPMALCTTYRSLVEQQYQLWMKSKDTKSLSLLFQ